MFVTVSTSIFFSKYSLIAATIAADVHSYHCLAIKPDGSVIGWGLNGYGQCDVPKDLSNVVSVSVGESHSLALKSNGTVVAWGDNRFGQCDIPADLSGVIDIAAGHSHSAALKSDGTVVIWPPGWGDTSTLSNVIAIDAGWHNGLALRSNGTIEFWGYPDNCGHRCDIPLGLSGIVEVAIGVTHSMALKEDGSVVAWGDNNFGECNVPDGLSDVISISAGGLKYLWDIGHSIALKQDGTIVAWGDNSLDQLDIPDGLFNAVSIAAGGLSNLALKSDGTLAAWGYDKYVPFKLSEAIAVDPGLDFSIAIQKDKSFACWGLCNWHQMDIPADPSDFKDLSAIAAGNLHVLALKVDGTVSAWGSNSWGQCNVPDTLSGAVAIDAGYDFNIILKSDGTVLSFGNNTYGQCDVPSGLFNVVKIAAGGYHSLALKADGTVVAWGNNDNGECSIPFDLSDVIEISAGDGRSIALKSDGTVVEWGDAFGIPVGLSDVVAISAGRCTNLALKSNGTVVAWGCEDFGMLNLPSGLSNVVAIRAGAEHCMAIKSDGSVVAWGDNTHCESNVPDVGPPFKIDSSKEFIFNLTTQGFLYEDDVFCNTYRPTYASGSHTPTDGYGGSGGLHVAVGNVDGKNILDGMSGGWSKNFDLDETSVVEISLKYRLMTTQYDADECGEALVAIDGDLVLQLDKLCGRGLDTGWKTKTFKQTLSAGDHTLTVGAYNNKKTGMREKSDAYFDDISVKIVSVYTPETDCSNGIDDDGDGLVDCNDPDCADSGNCAGLPYLSVDFDQCDHSFVYSDDVFYETNRPQYASGNCTAIGGTWGSGGLHLAIGNVDGRDILDGISGGWAGNFYLDDAAYVEVSLDYRLIMTQFDADECAQVLAKIDEGPVEVLEELCYRGQDTGWQTTTFMQWLPAGDHTITIGGYNNKKTGPREVADIYFDNVEVK